MRKLLAVTAAISLGLLSFGCATTSVVMMEPGQSYAPVSHTELLFKQPGRPYKQIAILESRGPVGTPLPDLLENMRAKGQDIGADAVVPVQDASQESPQGLMYNPWLGGYQTVGGGRAPIIRGVAIKYQ